VNTPALIIAGLIALLVIAGVIAVLLRRRKRRPATGPRPGEGPVPVGHGEQRGKD
jgi:LPXTG-motif cell wall-anchored protein